MFTTGSKLFFGATALSTVGAVVFAFSNGGPTGIMGTVGLLTLASVFAFLAGLNYFNRDGNVPAMEQGVQHTSAAAQRPVGSSMWPLIGAVGVAGLAIGAVSKPVVFKVALVVVLAAVVEWMVQGWSERASADPQYNAALRKRLLHPLEFPILGAIVLAFIVYSFSRILLGAAKEAGLVLFMVIGALIAIGGFLFASKSNLSRSTVVGVCSIAAVALLGAGVASALKGQREIEVHETTGSHPEKICLEPGVDEHVDEEASQDVSLKSNVVANVYLKADGTLMALVDGTLDVEYQQISVPRSATVGIIFHNDTGQPQRLTARLGKYGEAEEILQCTTAVNSGKQSYLSIKVTKSNAHSSTPMVLQVPGLDDQVIKILVP